jgi:NADPH:quinone reductase
MRSAVIDGPRSIAITTVAVPEPGPGEVRIAVEGCGVCGSDLPVWEGRPWFEYPREAGAPGHEAWGVVDAIGERVHDVEVGSRVAVLGYHGYAEYDLAAADTVVPLPAALAGRPFPGEPLACAVNVAARAGIAPGDTVAVIGVGFLGALITALAAGAGARVIALSRRPTSRDTARAMGADAVLEIDDGTIGRVLELTGERGCDVVVEATGSQEALDLCGPLTRIRGRIVIAGFHQDGRRSVDMQLWNWRGLDVVNAHERVPERYVEGMRQAVALAAAGSLSPEPLMTHSFALEQLGEAFAMLHDRPEGFVKAVIVP